MYSVNLGDKKKTFMEEHLFALI